MLKVRHYKSIKEICIVGKDHEIEMQIYTLQRELEKRSFKVLGNENRNVKRTNPILA